MLNLAVQWGRLADNPATGLRLPKAPRERHRAERVLDVEQLTTLVEGTQRGHLGRCSASPAKRASAAAR